jgi:hypothetical protein
MDGFTDANMEQSALVLRPVEMAEIPQERERRDGNVSISNPLEYCRSNPHFSTILSVVF